MQDDPAPPSLSILRFAAHQVAVTNATARLQASCDAAVAASRARAGKSADALAARAARGLTPPTPARRKVGGSTHRRRTEAVAATGATAAALAAAVAEEEEGSGNSTGQRPPSSSPTSLAAAVVADRRAALAAAAAVATPPSPPPTSWPYPAVLPPGSSARLTPWPSLRAPLSSRPLPSFPASDGRRAGRAEPLWWPPPGSGARLLAAAPALTGAARLSGSGGSGGVGSCAAALSASTTAPPPASSFSGRGPQHAAEVALASSRHYTSPADAIAPSPAPPLRPPPGWAGPPFVVRRSRVAGLGLYILVPAPQGAYLLDYSGTVVRAGGIADARERAYTRGSGGGGSGGGSGVNGEAEPGDATTTSTDAGWSWCEAGGTYMFNCGAAVWGGSARGGAAALGAAAFLASADAASLPRPRAAKGAPTTLVVDATQAGSAARFINHSCAPNCVAIVEPPATAWSGWFGGIGGGGGVETSTAAPGAARCGAAVAAGLPRVSLYAARALVPGEELFFEYRLSPPEPGDLELVCRCGAAGCRGVL